MGLLDSAGWNLDDAEVVQLERASLVAQLCNLDASLEERAPDDVWCPEYRTLDLSFHIDVDVLGMVQQGGKFVRGVEAEVSRRRGSFVLDEAPVLT